jgi:hypothetical protein
MKDVEIHKRVTFNKIYFIAAIVLVSCFVTACAGKTATKEIDSYYDSQQKWLLGLREGMSPEEALGQVISYQQYFFQYKKNEKLFQYMQGQYPVTGMVFGLFFEDGNLTNLRLNQGVNNYGGCHDQLSIGTTIAWIKQENRLGGEFDDVRRISTRQNTNENKKISGSEVGQIIAILPLAVVALPFALVDALFIPDKPDDKLVEEPDKIDPRRNGVDIASRRLAASQIELGVATDSDLIRLLGDPDYKEGKFDTWYYNFPKIKFGFVNNTVGWSESCFWSSRGVFLNSTEPVLCDFNFRCEPPN